MVSEKVGASALWDDVLSVRRSAPLIHNITNFVVMNFTANVLLAVGASPVMAHAREEVEDMAGIAQALVLNIGTLEPAWIDSMKLALAVALRRKIPCVLDPVGAGATRYRNEAIAALLAVGAPAVVRGNASEIMSVSGEQAKTKGVDSAAEASDALSAARNLARRIDGVVCVSGATDHVIGHDGRHARLANGDAWMTKLTGTGCAATALIGAFAAVQKDYWRATIAAMALLSIAGEAAAAKVRAQGAGVGSLSAAMIDAMQLMEEAEFTRRLKLEL
jgi:hydroxyethylthiazole kinase